MTTQEIEFGECVRRGAFASGRGQSSPRGTQHPPASRDRSGRHTRSRADAIVASVLACLGVAGEIWTRSDGTASLAELVKTAVAAIRN
jgi:hypothetical protein